MKRSSIYCHLAALLGTGLSLGCQNEQKTEEKPPPAPVQVIKAATGQHLEQWTELLGTTQPPPNQVGLISAPVEGQVVWVLGGQGQKQQFQEGQWVNQGDVIVQLNDVVLRGSIIKLEGAQRKLADQKKQADIAVQVAQIEVDKLKALEVQKIPVAPSDLTKANLALDTARLQRQAVETDVKAGEDELKALRAQIQLYALKAPLDGNLSRIEVVPGQTLPAGTRVAEVINLREHIDVLCYVPPAIIDLIHRDQPARLVTSADADADKLPGGTVVYKANQAQLETGNFPIKVRFRNQQLKRLANEVVRVRVRTLVKDNAETVPESAVLEDEDPPVVVVVRPKTRTNDKGEKETFYQAFRLPVRLGIRDRAHKRIEIEAILEEGKTLAQQRAAVANQMYVEQGGHGLQDEDEVKLEETKEK